MNRTLILIGVCCLVVDLAWPWLKHLPLGRLPGDFLFTRGNVRLYFPLASSIIVSLALTLLFWLFRK